MKARRITRTEKGRRELSMKDKVSKKRGEGKRNTRRPFLRFTEGAVFFLPGLGFTLGKSEVRDNIIIRISLNLDAISGIRGRQIGHVANMTRRCVQCHHNGIQFYERKHPVFTQQSRSFTLMKCFSAGRRRTD